MPLHLDRLNGFAAAHEMGCKAEQLARDGKATADNILQLFREFDAKVSHECIKGGISC